MRKFAADQPDLSKQPLEKFKSLQQNTNKSSTIKASSKGTTSGGSAAGKRGRNGPASIESLHSKAVVIDLINQGEIHGETSSVQQLNKTNDDEVLIANVDDEEDQKHMQTNESYTAPSEYTTSTQRGRLRRENQVLKDQIDNIQRMLQQKDLSLQDKDDQLTVM